MATRSRGWRQTYNAWTSGESPKDWLPLPTFYRHRAQILDRKGVDIKERNFDLFVTQQKEGKS